MSSTNHTTNYGLSQFLGTDKPAWLVDYNGDMAAIDTQMKANADAAAGAQTTANTADGKADTNATAISTLNTQINGDSGIAADVTTLQGSVNTITSLIGNGEPTTSDKTLIGAINELNGELATSVAVKTMIATKSVAGLASTNTIQEASTALLADLNATIAALADGEVLELNGVTFTGFAEMFAQAKYVFDNTGTAASLDLTKISTGPAALNVCQANVLGSSSTITQVRIVFADSSTEAVLHPATDLLSSVGGGISGVTYSYTVYKHIS